MKNGSLFGIKKYILCIVALMLLVFVAGCSKQGEGKVEGYSIVVDSYHVNLLSLEEVKKVLNGTKDKYDTNGLFSIKIDEKELNSTGQTTAVVYKNDGSANMIKYVSMYGEGVGTGFNPTRGIPSGMVGLDFEQKVVIKKASFNKGTEKSWEDALSDITKDKDKNQTYIVEPGDCLGLIAQNLDMDIDKLVSLNGFEDEGEILHVGDELIVSVPEPPLSVLVNEVKTEEETYEADTQYIPRDDWYTTQKNVVSEGTKGRRIATKSTVSRNGRPKSKGLVASVIVEESKAAVVEKGTQTPPTYIKPLSGGRFTSGFGPRWGTTHKGIDWATPTGTPVYASCGGTVVRAERSSSYGYVVYINHPDGRQTRYAHNSQLLVSAGDTVKQGQVIAKSGNTGNSTGPHVHFELLIGGAQVNPLRYLS